MSRRLTDVIGSSVIGIEAKALFFSLSLSNNGLFQLVHDPLRFKRTASDLDRLLGNERTKLWLHKYLSSIISCIIIKEDDQRGGPR